MSQDPKDAVVGDPKFFSGHPDGALGVLRETCPVAKSDDDEFWIVTKHRDVQTMSRDPERFCSRRGVLLSDRARQVSADDSLLYLDPPRHAQYRQLVNRAFTPSRVTTLEPRIRGSPLP